MLPIDMRARVLRANLEVVASEIQAAELEPVLAAHLDGLMTEACRHAQELEDALCLPVAASVAALPVAASIRRLVGHAEPGSNVVTLRAR